MIQIKSMEFLRDGMVVSNLLASFTTNLVEGRQQEEKRIQALKPAVETSHKEAPTLTLIIGGRADRPLLRVLTEKPELVLLKSP